MGVAMAAAIAGYATWVMTARRGVVE
jgi:hypothetical protein